MSNLWTFPLLLIILQAGEMSKSEVYEFQMEGPLDIDTYMILRLKPLLQPHSKCHEPQPQGEQVANPSCRTIQENYTHSYDPRTVSFDWGEDRTTYSPEEGIGTSNGELSRSPLAVANDLHVNGDASNSASTLTGSGITSGVPRVLDNYTLCVAFSVFFFTQYANVVSYQTKENQDDISISVLVEHLTIRLKDMNHFIPMRLYPDTWCHLCLIATPERITLYNYGQELSTWSHDVGRLPLDGVLVVGQDQDTLGGGFSVGQAFRGRVSQLLLWQRHLTVKEMNSLADCQEPPPTGALFPWGSPPWQLHGRITETETSHCRQEPRTLFPFERPLTFEKAVSSLDKVGMVMFMPRDDSQLRHVLKLLADYSARCSSAFQEGKYVMLNGYYDHQTNTIRDPASNVTLQQTLPASSYSFNRSGHMYLRESGYMGLYNYKSASCFMAEYQQDRHIFTLWGLCHNEFMKKYMTFVLSVNKNDIYFAGLFGMSIKKTGSTWSVHSLIKNVTLATLETTSLPIGRRLWNLTGDDEDCTLTSGFQPLVLSTCNHTDQFTCTDGSCVDMTARCDLNSDCNDWSDEQNCKLVKTPKGYLVHLPPQPPINMSIAISFHNIDVDLLKMAVRLEIDIHLVWYDTRVTFLNLRSDTTSNIVTDNAEQKTSVWVPQLDISPAIDFGPFISGVITVNRITNGQVNHSMYKGEENPMNLSKMIMPTMRCPFSLWLYPWDEQQCHFRLSVTNVRSDSINFANYSFKYTGNKTFDEYYLCSWAMYVSNNTGFISFKLQRQAQKHIWSTYVPTCLLLGISYGTLYIPAESFTDRGTMSLTTLLVLVSLYTESLSTLPTTAYNKLIDIWYLFIIVYVTLIIAVHLATSNPDTTYPQSKRFLTKRPRGVEFWIHHINTTTILKAAQVVFALAFVAYFLYYIYLLC